MPVVRLRKLADPVAPKRLPEAPLPKTAPISAPLPCCIRTKPIIATATRMWTVKTREKSQFICQPINLPPGKLPENHSQPKQRRRSNHHRQHAGQTTPLQCAAVRCHRTKCATHSPLLHLLPPPTHGSQSALLAPAPAMPSNQCQWPTPVRKPRLPKPLPLRQSNRELPIPDG